MNIFAEFAAKPYQLWLILGGVLLAIELLGTAGYALWSGVSAIVVAIIVWILPLNWQMQWIIFSVLTIIVAVLWWKWSQSRAHKKKGSSLLNRPYLKFIGNQCTLIEPVKNGFGRAKMADSSWRVKSDIDLPAGTTVVIEGVEGNTLIVKPVKTA